MKDLKFTWKQPNGTFWVGPNPPAGSTPLGIYYPRASTLGGYSEHNSMIALYPAKANWEIVANITGDTSWARRTCSNIGRRWRIINTSLSGLRLPLHMASVDGSTSLSLISD